MVDITKCYGISKADYRESQRNGVSFECEFCKFVLECLDQSRERMDGYL